jgi:DNA polymerase-3 subunit chi
MNTQVVFLLVSNNVSKQLRICEVVQKQFHKKQAILIYVPSDEAARYVDQLLWRQPEESFIPHLITNKPTKERIAITTSKQNMNAANILINLCPHPIEFAVSSVTMIYDLLDLSHPAKEQASRSRQTAYQLAGYSVEES